MKKTIGLAVAVTLLAAGPVLAKDTMKGAAVGAAAGHFVGKGHAKAGAVAGAAIGHHHGNKVKAAQAAK